MNRFVIALKNFGSAQGAGPFCLLLKLVKAIEFEDIEGYNINRGFLRKNNAGAMGSYLEVSFFYDNKWR